MRTFLIFIVFVALSAALNGQTLTIGTGTESQNKPFDMWHGYTRSAAIYSASEMGDSKFIQSLGWDVATSDIEICPVKIYLRLYTSVTLSTATWTSLISGATLVFDGNVSFPATGWKAIDIADFVYTSGQNLLVLCEANYGGNGVQTNLLYFNYTNTYSLYQHEGWEENYSAPTGTGTIDYQRPNIQITYLPLTTPNPPSGFMATGSGTSQVTLNWAKNSAGNNVMVAFNTVNVFGIPTGNYQPGSPISGGGTVIYNSSGTSFVQTSGLNPASTYYYRAWSVLPPTPVYSLAASASATTLCVPLTTYPDTTDFETPLFPPVCWSLTQKPWMRNDAVSAYGLGTGSAFADFYNLNIPAGTVFDLWSPTLNLSDLSSPVLSFDHAYATYSGESDMLELYASSDDGATITLVASWEGGLSGPLNTGGATTDPFIPTSSQWASKSQPVPPGTNKLLFRATSALGNYLYLDNIIIAEPTLTWNGSVSNQWHDPMNWSPNNLPGDNQDVTIPAGTAHPPVISTSSPACKNITINSGAILLINNGAVLTVESNLTIQHDATLTNNGTLKIKGNLINQNY